MVFTGNPMQTIHDQLLDHDVVVSSDYGFKSAAKKTVNTKMIMAKPSKEAKKLLNVWQKAEASYREAAAFEEVLRRTRHPEIERIVGQNRRRRPKRRPKLHHAHQQKEG